MHSSSQVIIWAYPAFTWYATSSATRAIDSSYVAKLCGPCSTTATIVSHAQGTPQSMGTPVSHSRRVSAKG
jgi:hypothetical protein